MGAQQRHGPAELAEHAPGEHSHPRPAFYVLVATILTVITAIEVAVFYIPALDPVLVPVLLTLSTIKLTMVVMFYMHLRFDSRVFSGVFIAPLTLAVLVVISLIVLMRYLPALIPG